MTYADRTLTCVDCGSEFIHPPTTSVLLGEGLRLRPQALRQLSRQPASGARRRATTRVRTSAGRAATSGRPRLASTSRCSARSAATRPRCPSGRAWIGRCTAPTASGRPIPTDGGARRRAEKPRRDGRPVRLAAMTTRQRGTLARGHARVGDRLPRRDVRAHRAPADRRGAAEHARSASSRARRTSRPATSRPSPRSSCSPARSATTTAAAASFMIGLVGFGVTSIMCGLAPQLRDARARAAAPGHRRRAARPGLARRSSRTRSRARPGPAPSGSGRPSTSALGTLGPPIGGIIVEPAGWRALFLINVPLVVLAVWLRAVHGRDRATRRATGHFDWLGAIVAAVAIGGLAFGAMRG